MRVVITIDTEEDDWGLYEPDGATVENIGHLLELQDLFDRRGARPTYLVDRPPLIDRGSVEILGRVADRPSVEIGAHCHPWNTPPFASLPTHVSMMCAYPSEQNLAKIREIRRCLRAELGVDPKSFKAGRWALGPSVSGPLAEEGFEIDCSVTPFIDFTEEGGPDYSDAPTEPYRFDPDRPLGADADGALFEVPVTVGYLGGDDYRSHRFRQRLEGPWLNRLRLVGPLDRLGVLRRRWLTPEMTDVASLIALADAAIASGRSVLHLTFHSCTLLPGATPFVQDEGDRRRFLRSVDLFLKHCESIGVAFRTLSELSSDISRRADRLPATHTPTATDRDGSE